MDGYMEYMFRVLYDNDNENEKVDRVSQFCIHPSTYVGSNNAMNSEPNAM